VVESLLLSTHVCRSCSAVSSVLGLPALQLCLCLSPRFGVQLILSHWCTW
jgi:hypothetical protein